MNFNYYLTGYTTTTVFKIILSFFPLISALALGQEKYGQLVELILYNGLFLILINIIAPQSIIYFWINYKKISILNLLNFVFLYPLFFFFISTTIFYEKKTILLLGLSSLLIIIQTTIKCILESEGLHEKIILRETFSLILSILISIIFLYYEFYVEIIVLNQGLFGFFFFVFSIRTTFRLINFKHLSILRNTHPFGGYNKHLYLFNFLNYGSKNSLGFLISKTLDDSVLGRYGILMRIANLISEISVNPSVRIKFPEFMKLQFIPVFEYLKLILRSLTICIVFSLTACAIILFDSYEGFIENFNFFNKYNFDFSEIISLIFLSLSFAFFSLKGIVINVSGKNNYEIYLGLMLLSSLTLIFLLTLILKINLTLAQLINSLAIVYFINGVLSNFILYKNGFFIRRNNPLQKKL